MTDSGPELVKGFADECDKLWVWRGGDALRAKRGHTSPLQDRGLHGMRHRAGTVAREEASCQPEAWRKVSEETDGSGKAAKGQNYNIMTVGEKEWHSAINL